MNTAVRRLLSVARTCKRAVRSCAKSVRKTVLRCSWLKRNNKGKDHETMIVTSTEEQVIDSQEAIENRTNFSAMGHRQVIPISADCTSHVVFENKPKKNKSTKRAGRSKRKSGANPPVELMPEEKPKKTEEGNSRDTETLAESVSLTAPDLRSHSATENEAEACKGQEEKKSKSVRRKRCKSNVDSQLPTDGISQSIPSYSSKLAQRSVTKNEKEAPKSRTNVTGTKQPENVVEVPPKCERINEKPRKQPRIVSDDVSRAKEIRAVVCKQTTESSKSTPYERTKNDRNCKGEPTDTSNVSGDNTITKSSGVVQCGALEKKRNTADGENKAAVKRKAVNIKLESEKKIELNKAEKTCVPRTAMRKTDVAVTYAGVAKKRSHYMNEELNKKATSILNNISRGNAVKLTEKFKNLPIDTIECLESITALVLEKAIEKPCFAPLYAALCSAMQSVLVTCPESKRTVTFKALILGKCQDIFEADKLYRTETTVKELAKINSCINPEKKLELQLEYEKNERRMNKRSMGNCRFIGELFKERVVSTNIILYCIVNLVDQRSEQPLESLCNLLMIVAEELERCTSLKGTFKKLNALTSDKCVSTRMRSMIRDVINLRRNRWSRDVKTRKTS